MVQIHLLLLEPFWKKTVGQKGLIKKFLTGIAKTNTNVTFALPFRESGLNRKDLAGLGKDLRVESLKSLRIDKLDRKI